MEPTQPQLKNVTLKRDDRSVDMVLRDDSSTRLVLREIFTNHVYSVIPGLAPPRAVLDIGAHIGVASGFFRLVYPDAAIFCVEPDPDSYAILARNAERIGRCEAFNIGLLDRDMTAAFNAAKISVLSSLFPYDEGAIATDTIDVTVRDAGSFAAEISNRFSVPGFDIIKIDTEGAELPILRSLGPVVGRASVIHLEFHSHEDRRAIDDLLCATHCLCQGRIEKHNRGTLTYLASHLLPANRSSV